MTAASSPWRVRALAARRAVLSFDQQRSIGDRSGEYGGKGEETGPPAFKRCLYPIHFVGPPVVHDDDVARLQGRSQDVLERARNISVSVAPSTVITASIPWIPRAPTIVTCGP